jgi:hypothetical protein
MECLRLKDASSAGIKAVSQNGASIGLAVAERKNYVF